tara:strand:- start:1070 stop:2764 length:1695 start_codon:yes stop_codon:yes gene_type:complete
MFDIFFKAQKNLGRVSNNSKKYFKLILIVLIIGAFLEFLSVSLLFPVFLNFIDFTENINSFEIFQKFKNLGFDFEKFQIENFILFTIFFFIFRFFFLLSRDVIVEYYVLNIARKFKLYQLKVYSNLPLNTFSKEKNSEIFKNIYIESNYFSSIFKSYLIIFQEIFVLIAILSLLFINDFLTTLIIIIFLICFSGIYFILVTQRIKWLGKIRSNLDNNIVETINNSLQGFKEIKLLRVSAQFYDNLNSYIKKFNVHNIKFNVLKNLTRPLFELILILAISIFLLINKSFAPSLILYGMVFIRLMPSISLINKSVTEINFKKISLDIINNQIFLENSQEKLSYPKNDEFKKYYEIKDLNFSYENQIIFKNANIKILKNKIHGIIGKSGSGKSTLVNILSGLINPTDGKYYIDDSEKKNFYDLRNYVSLVSQNSFVINDTILYNITFKEKELTINENKLLDGIIELSGLDEIFKKNNLNLNYQIGKDGDKLSGGQIQRIAIARALFQNKNLIIFDEATNALDKNSELEIFKKIKRLNKTIIIITHNENNLIHCDEIFSIEEQKIVKK